MQLRNIQEVTLACLTRVDLVQSQVSSLVSSTIFHLINLLDDVVYIANVGDSRALMSVDGGKYTVMLSTDHKPNDEAETKRIVEAGGRIYQ